MGGGAATDWYAARTVIWIIVGVVIVALVGAAIVASVREQAKPLTRGRGRRADVVAIGMTG